MLFTIIFFSFLFITVINAVDLFVAVCQTSIALTFNITCRLVKSVVVSCASTRAQRHNTGTRNKTNDGYRYLSAENYQSINHQSYFICQNEKLRTKIRTNMAGSQKSCRAHQSDVKRYTIILQSPSILHALITLCIFEANPLARTNKASSSHYTKMREPNAPNYI